MYSSATRKSKPTSSVDPRLGRAHLRQCLAARHARTRIGKSTHEVGLFYLKGMGLGTLAVSVPWSALPERVERLHVEPHSQRELYPAFSHLGFPPAGPCVQGTRSGGKTAQLSCVVCTRRRPTDHSLLPSALRGGHCRPGDGRPARSCAPCPSQGEMTW